VFQQETSHGIKDCIHCFLLLVITDGNHVLNLHRQAALGRQDLSCMYLTRHEVESVNIIIIISIIIILLLILIILLYYYCYSYYYYCCYLHMLMCLMHVQRLDLTANRIATVNELETLMNLPSLQQLILVSNPVAARSATFTRTFSNVSDNAAFVKLSAARQLLACCDCMSIQMWWSHIPAWHLELHDFGTIGLLHAA